MHMWKLAIAGPTAWTALDAGKTVNHWDVRPRGNISFHCVWSVDRSLWSETAVQTCSVKEICTISSFLHPHSITPSHGGSNCTLGNNFLWRSVSTDENNASRRLSFVFLSFCLFGLVFFFFFANRMLIRNKLAGSFFCRHNNGHYAIDRFPILICRESRLAFRLFLIAVPVIVSFLSFYRHWKWFWFVKR